MTAHLRGGTRDPQACSNLEKFLQPNLIPSSCRAGASAAVRHGDTEGEKGGDTSTRDRRRLWRQAVASLWWSRSRVGTVGSPKGTPLARPSSAGGGPRREGLHWGN